MSEMTKYGDFALSLYVYSAQSLAFVDQINYNLVKLKIFKYLQLCTNIFARYAFHSHIT